MPKTLATLTAPCFSAIKNNRGTALQFANSIEQTPRGPAAREVITWNVQDKTLGNLFEVGGKKYTITITEEDTAPETSPD